MKHLLKHLDKIKNKKLILLLDYDGTLTPIVSRPELAVLSDDMRDVLKKIAKRYPLAIISGRSLEDVKKLVDVENIYYAGNHGFEITNDVKLVNPDAEKIKPVINEICRKMQKR
ncbi:MAG: trehalose-phosphatase, partial [Candidatus Thermoplasmatota archaeon]|nr:trehalose-phosphatase [Candidatus Thermoplasmatota archaeon]